MATKNISLDYTPREWQTEFHLGAHGKRNAIAIAGRQLGKTHCVIAELVDRALKADNGDFAYLAPSQLQARRIAWVRLKSYLEPLSEYITVSETQLTITLPGNKTLWLLGLENEGIRGLSLRGIVADEFDNMDLDRWRSVVLPTLINYPDHWILFIGTLAAGQSRLYQLYLKYKEHKDWHCQIIKASSTGLISDDEMAKLRESMGDSAFMREIECDPHAPVSNSVLGENIAAAEREGRVPVYLPVDPFIQVHTAWDLGFSDATAIWFFQLIGNMINVIDYREYAQLSLTEIGERVRQLKHNWGRMILPHDSVVTEYTTGASRLLTFRELKLGIPDKQPKMNIVDTLSASRLNLRRCVFNGTACEKGLIHLKSARFKVDGKTDTVLNTIVHDQASHALDAFRYLCAYVENRYRSTGSTAGRSFTERLNKPKAIPALGRRRRRSGTG